MKTFNCIYALAISLLLIAGMHAQSKYSYDVKDFGAKGDGVILDTKAIQSAIDECSSNGGTVYFSPGKYLTGSLELKDNVDIYIDNGAVILGSTDIKDYTEHKPKMKSYNDTFLRYSLLYAEGVKNIYIRGEGTIDGQGSYFKVKTKEKPVRYKNRPFVIRFVDCENVKVENVTLKNSAMWMQQYLACKDLTIHGVKVYNHANQNNDMMDIDGCKNVIISDCIGDTDDDGITLKSTSPAITENVAITNCIISSHCNAIKLGTESTGGFKNIVISNMIVKPSEVKDCIFGLPGGIGGITLTNVDGGILEGITISNIRIDGAEVPIFLRLGNRARKYKVDIPSPGVGTFSDIKISNVSASNAGTTGCSITGIPGHDMENVSLSNISISFKGDGTIKEPENPLPELADNYPESTMWGKLPAYGFYIRHAKGISFSDIQFHLADKDPRPALVMNEVKELKITGLTASAVPESNSLIKIIKCQNILISNSNVAGKSKSFIEVGDSESKNILLYGNDLRKFRHPYTQIIDGQVETLDNFGF